MIRNQSGFEPLVADLIKAMTMRPKTTHSTPQEQRVIEIVRAVLLV